MQTLVVACVLVGSVLTGSPPELHPSDHVDIIELNHKFDDAGRETFQQYIFYEWDARAGRFQVRAWRIRKDHAIWPHYDFHARCYRLTWFDDARLRVVRANSCIETWTYHDPEILERGILPNERRRGLSR